MVWEVLENFKNVLFSHPLWLLLQWDSESGPLLFSHNVPIELFESFEGGQMFSRRIGSWNKVRPFWDPKLSERECCSLRKWEDRAVDISRQCCRINGLVAGSPIIPLRSASLDKKIIPSDFPFRWEKGCLGFVSEYWCSTGVMNDYDWFHSESKKMTLWFQVS